MRYAIGFAIGFALACWMFSKPAHAHDEWLNHRQVDPLTKRLCCSQADCHPVDASLVHATNGGYRLDDTGEIIEYDRAQPSPDGFYWACRWNHMTQCLFAPPMGY